MSRIALMALGLSLSLGGTQAPARGAPEGARCQTTSECASGLECMDALDEADARSCALPCAEQSLWSCPLGMECVVATDGANRGRVSCEPSTP